jgi:diazepam-binding inhibitor (GABA receptor modulating acyl-CoA-binding protein)
MSEVKFKNALEEVKKTNPSDQEKLQLYGLYKQVNFGDNNESQPWSYQVEKSYKWKAWKDNSGMDREKAMEAYVELVDKLKK